MLQRWLPVITKALCTSYRFKMANSLRARKPMAAQLLPPCICRPYFDCADAEGRAVCISTVLELFQRLALRPFALAVLFILSSRSLLGQSRCTSPNSETRHYPRGSSQCREIHPF